MQAACTAMIRSAKAYRGGRRAISAPPHTPDTRATRDSAERAPHRHRQSRFTGAHGAHPARARGASPARAGVRRPARQRREPSGCRLLYRFALSSRVRECDADLSFVFRSLRVSASHVCIHRASMDIYLHTIRHPDRSHRPQLSVSRTTRAHNRTRARSPPLLSIHALHSASGAHTRQRPHRARSLHARTPHWRPLPFCTHACTCHLARARSSPRRERGTPARGASSVRRPPLSRDHGSITQTHCQQTTT